MKSTLGSDIQLDGQSSQGLRPRPRRKKETSKVGSWFKGLGRLRCTVGWEEVEDKSGGDGSGRGVGVARGNGSEVGRGSENDSIRVKVKQKEKEKEKEKGTL